MAEEWDYSNLVTCHVLENGARLFLMYDHYPFAEGGNEYTGACLVENPDIDSDQIAELLGCDWVPKYIGEPE